MSDTKVVSPAQSRPGTSSDSSAQDPFASPVSSRTPSLRYSTYGTPTEIPSPLRNLNFSMMQPVPPPTTVKPTVRMRSHMISETEPMPKPWNNDKKPRAALSYYLTYGVIVLGVAVGVLQCYFGYKGVRLDRKPLCLVMEENFDNEDSVFGENGHFSREVNMDGFGNGEFEMTTDSTNNSFVKDGMLYIVPTLTSDAIGSDAIFDGSIYNITGCTFNDTQPNGGYIGSTFDTASYNAACSAISNATTGSVINPVQSARMTTRKSASIRFGRVEVRAKMPVGDWMWPAIWMLPVDNVYGPWPMSGEIDMVESRGNGLRYTARGSNYVQGSLNFGPTPGPYLNGVQHAYSWWTERRKQFNTGFHTYALEWTEDFLRVYVDTRLHTLLDMPFKKSFFQRGDFPTVISNGTGLQALENPWINGTNATPFDQDFFLILNVAVGSTNGWFPEVQGNKPWLDHAGNPMRDFAKAQSQWYPTWPSNIEERAMVVDYVKMWKHC